MQKLKKEDVVQKFDTTERYNVRLLKDKAHLKAGDVIKGVGRVIAATYIKNKIGEVINEDGERVNFKGKVIKTPEEALLQ